MLTYLDTAGLALRAGLTASTIRVYLSQGLLPEPDVHAGRTPGWLLETVDAWLASRPARRPRSS